jgi:hypothetical protein
LVSRYGGDDGCDASEEDEDFDPLGLADSDASSASKPDDDLDGLLDHDSWEDADVFAQFDRELGESLREKLLEHLVDTPRPSLPTTRVLSIFPHGPSHPVAPMTEAKWK